MGSDAGLGEPVEQLTESLELLRHVLGARAVEVVAAADAEDAPDAASVAGALTETAHETLRTFAREWLTGASPSSEFAGPVGELHAWIRPLLTPAQEVVAALVVVTAPDQPLTDADGVTLRGHSALIELAFTRARVARQMQHQRRLDELVTRVAVRLMSTPRTSVSETIAWTLTTLGEFFGVDTVFLRRNEHSRGMSVLVDEWPRRVDVPDPDPLGVVPFDVDPVFGATRELREPFVIRPQASPQEYQERVQQGSGIPEVAMAMVPLVHDELTEGVLGFVNFGDRAWPDEEVNALQAIASLIMHFQARIDAEEQLRHNAFHDSLTGLANRRALLAELERRLKMRLGPNLALLFLDLDHFKAMNDVLGHRAGDRFLVATADRLSLALRPQDLAARIGGDEFVVVLGGPIDGLEAYVVANRLRELVGEPIDFGAGHINRTVSVGIALASAGAVSAEDLLTHADAALYTAKVRGRNQIVLFDDELRAEVDERFMTEMLLRGAIDDRALCLHYQPEVDMRDGRLLAVEALVRWEHPTRGLLPASEFITVAEETGLVVDLGRWVLSEACRQMAAWLTVWPALDLSMRVNVSPAQLMGPTLVDYVSDRLREHHLDGRRLCLEITEHAVMPDVERSVQVLDALRELGVTLAIDDFGTGHSSMAQLKRLPVNALKIDQSFVRGLTSEAGDRAIIESIVRLAEAFHLDLVAEGVESRDQARQLLALGCHRGQGFLFAPAMPPEEIVSLITQDRALSRF
jgi:diguanylate cyclase (GGDEF)-like protein